MGEQFPIVSIVMPVFNEEENLSQTLASLAQSDYSADRYEIIVVDNGSTDDSVNVATGYGVNVILKPGVKVGEVRNFGASEAKGEIIVFLDSDCLVSPGWLRRGVGFLTDEGFDAVGGLFSLRENPSWIERNWIIEGGTEVAYQNTFIGACIFIKKQVFNRLNGFDVVLNAGEDCDLTERLRDDGYKIKIAPELTVVHLGYPTSINHFLRRQIWQSSDAFRRLMKLDLDKTLVVVAISVVSIIGFAIASLITFEPVYLIISLIVFVVTPLVFTAKRLVRAGFGNTRRDYISIYLVDALYTIGRMIGLMKGGYQALAFNKNQKTYK